MEKVVTLTPDDLPKEWYNLIPDLPADIPPMKDPETRPSLIAKMPKMYTKTSLGLEESKERWIRIPEEVRELYIQIGRPYPLNRARRLERFLKTPARIYYKREDLSPFGNHKINTIIPQVYWAMREGDGRLTDFNMGGTPRALAYCATAFGLKSTAYVPRATYEQRPDLRCWLEMLGMEVVPSPSKRTPVGRRCLQENPNHQGSFEIVVAESFEDAELNDDTVVVSSTVRNVPIINQSIIGLETKRQMELIDEKPDIFIACTGGGSNLTGLIAPYINDFLDKKLEARFVAVESNAAARLTRGEYRYDYPDISKHTPLMKMYTLGVDTPRIHMGMSSDIEVHCASPILSILRNTGMIDTAVYPRDEEESMVLEAAKIFLQTEGFLIHNVSAYAIREVIDEALRAKQKGEDEVIVTVISGSGYMSLQQFQRVLYSR